MAAPLLSVGCAPHCNTLAVCSVFAAQASRKCFGGEAFHRAWLHAVVCAETSCLNGVGASSNRANLCILPPLFLSFLASTFCSTRALLLTTNSQHWRQHRTLRPLCHWCRLPAPPRCTASAPTALLPGRQPSSPLRGSLFGKMVGGKGKREMGKFTELCVHSMLESLQGSSMILYSA